MGAASSLQQQYEQVVSQVLPSVTNAHVVGTATTMEVGLANGGRPLAATIVGVFALDELAVIRVQGGTGSLNPRRSAGRLPWGSARSCWP